MFTFRAVLTHCQPFLSGSVRNWATKSNSSAEKWSIIVQFAVCNIQEWDVANAGGRRVRHNSRQQGVDAERCRVKTRLVIFHFISGQYYVIDSNK
jgi:hypothetical protein